MEQVINLYNKYGSAGYIGEDVTQYQHAMQCYFLAKNYIINNNLTFDNSITPKDIKIGAFLHDVGHLLEFDREDIDKMGDYGVMNHEIEGSKYLRSLGFSDNVCNLVENHINTKRYLITKDNNYYNNLSDASKKTFEYQGGKMKLDEITNFEKNKLFFWHLNLRQWDDLAKSTNKDLLDKISNYDINKVFQ